MTLEDFAHRCLMIKAGNVQLDIPCCANCKYYKEHPNGGVIYKNGKVIKEVTLSSYWECHNPASYDEDSSLSMRPEDFCSRWESRNEEKEVKKENKQA